jgi:hypothetical protein
VLAGAACYQVGLVTGGLQWTIATEIALGGALGWGWPHRPWRWALLMAAWFPLLMVLRIARGLGPWIDPEFLLIPLAFVVLPAAVGGYGGAWLRRRRRR